MGKTKKSILILTLSITALATVAFAFYYNGFWGSHLVLTKTTFSRIPNWKRDDQSKSLLAFQQSCIDILKRNPTVAFSTIQHSGKNSDWQTICTTANKLHNPDKSTARHFFESAFTPYHVYDNFNPKGLFTGYYLPLLHANLKQTKKYSTPIYAVPDDLIKINLGLFRPALAGTTIVGQINNHTLKPYPDRSIISNGGIQKNARVLAWSDNPIDVFFAQIQGSAIIQLPNHQEFSIGYAGNNGRPYTAIGKILVSRNALSKKNVSMQTIRTWLTEHPQEMDSILNQNASYVFFNILKNKDPVGTEQVALTPERSLAVDTRHIPLGAPLWLDTVAPSPTPTKKSTNFSKLVIAQDTGGAIKGIVRGDVYWGAGDKATFIAGHMQSPGQYWILLPKHQN